MRHAHLGWYRLLLKLYPKAYRQDYEEEMIFTLQEMFDEAETSAIRHRLIARVIKDYCVSVPQQSFYAAESSLSQAPTNVKREFVISASLLMPFFLICVYNVVSMVFHKGIMLGKLEVHAWVIYSIALPIISLMVSLKTCVGGTCMYLLRGEWHAAARVVLNDWLFLGIVAGILAVIAIL